MYILIALHPSKHKKINFLLVVKYIKAPCNHNIMCLHYGSVMEQPESHTY